MTWDQSSIPSTFSVQGWYNFFLNMTNSDSFCSCRSFGMFQAFSDLPVDAQTNLTLLNEVLGGTCNLPGPDGSNDEGAKDECTNSLRDLVEEMMDSCQKECRERNGMRLLCRLGLLSSPIPPSSSHPASHYPIQTWAGFPDSAKPSCGPCERDLLKTYEGWFDSTGSGSASSDASTSDPQEDNDNDPTLSHLTPRSRWDSKRRMRMQLWRGFVEKGSLITLRV
ncbi:hypothetical protein D9758_017250 [Tetrapyrgos nigripes]|uniref:DUF7729 domain-containing protein n=1 Tax=Tetrapyrgos nigripes TaxID=182062 RepID=A0A8H5C3S5_9AGAR|nr:hypothetical protein D9758_017250 [Tetrapyrgos nigripes]